MNGTSKGRQKNWLAVSLGIAVLVGWLAYAVVFVHRINRTGGSIATSEFQLLAQQESRDEWFAIYQHDTKAGYSHTRLLPQEEGYSIIEEIFLRLNFLGETQNVFTRTQGRLEPDFSLKSFTFRLQAGPIHYGLSGGVEDGNLVLESRMAGQEQTQRIPLSRPIYLGSAMKSFVSQQHLQVGDTYRLMYREQHNF